MASFEEVLEVALPNLCETCPLRNLCGAVEMARLEADVSGVENAKEQISVIEADAASDIVIASIFKAANGCDGPVKNEHVCDCGNDSTCGSYSTVVSIMQESEE
jgi:hypothetical protein